MEEEAWNAYPYTKTRYTCPFVEKFSLEIETYYFPDDGNQENVFMLSGNDLRNRVVGKLQFFFYFSSRYKLNIFSLFSDIIDIVKEQVYSADYIKDEDPKLFISEKTGRGPLADNWLAEYWSEVSLINLEKLCTKNESTLFKIS